MIDLVVFTLETFGGFLSRKLAGERKFWGGSFLQKAFFEKVLVGGPSLESLR